jgi:hypothetical protein
VCLQLTLDDESVHDLKQLGLSENEQVAQTLHSERLIRASGTTQKGLECCLFHSQDKGRTELLVVELVHLVDHFDREYVL